MKNKQWKKPLPFYNLFLLIIIAQSRLKQNLYKKYQQPTCSWFSSDSYDAFPSSDSMTSPSFWQKSYIYAKHHPSSICNCKPTRVLILEPTDNGMKQNPEIMVQFYLKWLNVLLYLDYKCKTLSFDGLGGNGLQLETIGPSFSSLTPVCRHVIEHMNNQLSVSRFPPAVVRHFKDSICLRSCMIVMWMTYLI